MGVQHSTNVIKVKHDTMNSQIPYEILAKYFTGECTPSEELQIESWRKEHDSNEAIFSELAEIWANAHSGNEKLSFDAVDGLKAVNSKIYALEKEKNTTVSKRNIPYYLWRVAAILILTAGIWFGYAILKDIKPAISEIRSTDELREVVLPDGTIVDLNKSSILRYPVKFRKRERIVWLEGEVFFSVSRDPERPFTIYTKKSVTQVLGTKFNIRAPINNGNVIITVTEGKVRFAGIAGANAETEELVAGERGIFRVDSGTVSKEKNTDRNFMAWKTGELVYDKTPLNIVLNDISKYFNITVYNSSASLDTVSVTLTIPLDIPSDKALSALEYISNTTVRKTDSAYFLTTRKKP